MAGYEVDPAALAASGKSIGAQGDALIAALGTLDSALAGSGLMCGTDRAGDAFFMNYRKGGQAVISAAESAVNALRNVGYGVEVSAHNYAVSDSMSTIGGGRESIPVPAEPTKYSASAIGGQSGPEIPQPGLWSVVEGFVDAPWPNGNPPTMRTVAQAWRALGTAISAASTQAGDCAAGLSGHSIPELATITGSVNDLTTGTHDLAGQCNSIAESLESFAGEVQSSQDAIRDLLHRLSASGILGELGRIFSGHNPMDDLRKIGHDISEILHTLSRELDATASFIQSAIDGLDGVIRTFEKWDRKEFTHFFGNEVGNMLADTVNMNLDVEEGVAKSVLEVAQSIPTMMAHPVDTIKGIGQLDKDLAETFTPLGSLDPQGAQEAREHLTDVGKSLIDYKDWSSDRPLVGLGDNVGNIAQVLIPGAGEAKAGVTAGRAGEEAAQVARVEGAAGRGGLDALAQGGGKEIAGQAGKVGKDLDGLATKPVDMPKVSDPAPVARPTDPAPAPRPADPAPAPKAADGGAAAGNSGAGRAPVDAGARPAAEAAPAQPAPAAHAPVDAPRAPAGEQPGPAAHSPTEGPPAAHGSGEVPPAAHSPAEVPHQAAAPAEPPAAGDSHGGVDSGHGGGGNEHGTGDQTAPADRSREYSMMDDSSHHTAFAPEQLSDAQRIDNALTHEGVSRSDFVDLINEPTGDLSPAERDLINDVRNDLPHPTEDTVMQKVIPPGHFDGDGLFTRSRADDYIMGDNPRVAVDQMGGAVTVAGDTAHLATPAEIYDGLRLDYADSPFEAYDPGTHVIRFQGDLNAPGMYDIPRNSDMGGAGEYDGWGEPFTGNGFTKAGDDVIPEYIAKKVTMRDGAEMWEVLDDGTQRLVAVLRDREWIPQGN